ncbi:hypothetical protein CTI14_70935, partial [Methylobacterium radiotolerans]
DLTKRGKVTEDVLGNVVDSINVMVDELSDLLRNVQDVADVTSRSAARSPRTCWATWWTPST